jgi:hypothetical protein
MIVFAIRQYDEGRSSQRLVQAPRQSNQMANALILKTRCSFLADAWPYETELVAVLASWKKPASSVTSLI